MSHIPKILDALSRLLSYPDEQTVQSAELLYVVLAGELPEAAAEAAKFGAYMERHDLHEVEEAFTRTFDVNPACALEVGWHLFGEEYARGMFLVRMREELRKYQLSESVELPDHLAHVLAIVAAMPDDEATSFVRACVAPAVLTMKKALDELDTPYRHLVECLSMTLTHVWGEVALDPDASTDRDGAFGGDLLRAFPVGDVGGCEDECGSDCGVAPLDLVQLQTNAPNTESEAPTPARKP